MRCVQKLKSMRIRGEFKAIIYLEVNHSLITIRSNHLGSSGSSSSRHFDLDGIDHY